MALTDQEIENFREAVSSLKKWRRAELLDDDDNQIIDQLYEDPYQDQHLYKDVMKPNTAFLIGRRGTGKSTVFQRVQFELRKNKKAVAAYVDVKKVHQNVDIDHVEFQSPAQSSFGHKIGWFQSFLTIFLEDLIDEISKKAGASIFSVMMLSRRANKEQAIADVRKLFDVENYVARTDVATLTHTTRSESEGNSRSSKKTADGKLSTTNAKISGSSSINDSSHRASSSADNAINMRMLQIGRFISDLKKALHGLGVKHVYIFIDDYSELPDDAMRFLMDNVIYPLESASGEYIKFKIAAYPGQYYRGELDPQKVDFFYLDLSAVYKTQNTTEMDSLAIDYTSRLLNKRLAYYCPGKPLDTYFSSDRQQILETLYHAAFCNPRALGWILDFCVDDKLSRGERISVDAIKGAARRYYEEKIEEQLNAAKFVTQSDEERSKVALCGELVAIISAESRSRRNYKESELLRSTDKKQNPASHFHCSDDCDSIMAPLVQLQFVNHYKDARDKDGKRISIYALNYGLCQKDKIPYGRPGNGAEFKDYFVQRVFNYTDVVLGAASNIEAFFCDHCGHDFPVSQQASFKVYNFRCPDCDEGLLSIAPRRKKAKASKDNEVQLSKVEYDFLATLHANPKRERWYARHIAPEIDIDAQVAGLVGRRLADLGYIERIKTKTVYMYKLTESAKKVFFGGK